MKREQWNDALSSIDGTLIEEHILQTERYIQTSRKRTVKRRIVMLCASLVLIFSLCFSLFAVLSRPPKYRGAMFSAVQIANLLNQKTDSVATNAYTTVYAPDFGLLSTHPVPDTEYLSVYKHNMFGGISAKGSLERLVERTLPALFASVGESVPQYETENRELGYSARAHHDDYHYYASSSFGLTRVSFSNYKETIVLDGNEVCVNQTITDDEIISSLEPVKNELFEIFGVSYNDAKVVRQYEAFDEYGVSRLYVYFYDKDAHSLNRFSSTPVSDHISVEFDNFKNYDGDRVDDTWLKNASIYYIDYSAKATSLYREVALCQTIPLEKAEEYLERGYVFGGHVCSLCMEMQDKVDFGDYDYVRLEYREGSNISSLFGGYVIPFYAFYKDIGTSKNGNTEYAKTLVPAIEVSGMDEYFKAQESRH